METQSKLQSFERAVEANSYASQGAVNLYGLISMQMPNVTLPSSPSGPEKNGGSEDEGSDRLCEAEAGPSVAHVSSV